MVALIVQLDVVGGQRKTGVATTTKLIIKETLNDDDVKIC